MLDYWFILTCMYKMYFTQKILLGFILLTLFYNSSVIAETTPAEVVHGERLFLETRFSEYFYQFIEDGGDYNQTIDSGDPQLDKTYHFSSSPPYQIPFVASPFKDSTFSCRTCHMVDEHLEQKELGMRTYSDFASRSPLPTRTENKLFTVRNSPILVSSSVKRENFLLHADGEFSSLKDLIIGTLTGRNLGWLPHENISAKQHICEVIKHDDGNSPLAQEFGGFSYGELLSSESKNGKPLPEEYSINKDYRTNIKTASCDEILNSVAYLIEEYVNDLQFAQDDSVISPYDKFLSINKLPRYPDDNETDSAYSLRLLALIDEREKSNNLKYVHKNDATKDSTFLYHDQVYKFTELELQGLKIFFNQSNNSEISQGNCIACHPAPHFTDFKFHNVGVTQVEYEAIHGINSFNKLPIPNATERTKLANTYLPATSVHPDRHGVFRKAASQSKPEHTDLGTWNILMNNDYPKPQEKLLNIICPYDDPCDNENIALQRSIATFKTPTLRNLGHSAPYMHNGQINDLFAVISFYINISSNSQRGLIRNSAKELNNMNLNPSETDALVHFLISLYEDYD